MTTTSSSLSSPPPCSRKHHRPSSQAASYRRHGHHRCKNDVGEVCTEAKTKDMWRKAQWESAWQSWAWPVVLAGEGSPDGTGVGEGGVGRGGLGA